MDIETNVSLIITETILKPQNTENGIHMHAFILKSQRAKLLSWFHAHNRCSLDQILYTMLQEIQASKIRIAITA